MHEFVTLFKNACDFLYVDFFFILAFSPQTKIAVDNDFPPVKTFVSCWHLISRYILWVKLEGKNKSQF